MPQLQQVPFSEQPYTYIKYQKLSYEKEYVKQTESCTVRMQSNCLGGEQRMANYLWLFQTNGDFTVAKPDWKCSISFRGCCSNHDCSLASEHKLCNWSGFSTSVSKLIYQGGIVRTSEQFVCFPRVVYSEWARWSKICCTEKNPRWRTHAGVEKCSVNKKHQFILNTSSASTYIPKQFQVLTAQSAEIFSVQNKRMKI